MSSDDVGVDDDDDEADLLARASAHMLLWETAQLLGRPPMAPVARARRNAAPAGRPSATSTRFRPKPDDEARPERGTQRPATGKPRVPRLPVAMPLQGMDTSWLATPRRSAASVLNVESTANDLRFDWPPAPTPREAHGRRPGDSARDGCHAAALPRSSSRRQAAASRARPSSASYSRPAPAAADTLGAGAHSARAPRRTLASADGRFCADAPACQGNALCVARRLRSATSGAPDTAARSSMPPPSAAAEARSNSAGTLLGAPPALAYGSRGGGRAASERGSSCRWRARPHRARAPGLAAQ